MEREPASRGFEVRLLRRDHCDRVAGVVFGNLKAQELVQGIQRRRVLGLDANPAAASGLLEAVSDAILQPPEVAAPGGVWS